MKGLILTLLICFAVIAANAYASSVSVGISQKIDGGLVSFEYDNSTNPIGFFAEFYNTGSVPYKARMKTEIYDQTQLISSSWSQEEDFMPGEKKTFSSHWYAKSSGNYSAKTRLYFANEIIDYKKLDFSVNKMEDPKNVFEIRNFRTYDGYVLFDIESKGKAENVIIMPSDYLPGWIFEQAQIESIDANTTKCVKIGYIPSLWAESDVNISIASNSGSYFSKSSLKMERNDGIAGLFYFIADSIRCNFLK